MIRYTDAAGRVHEAEVLGAYSKKVDVTNLDLGPPTGSTLMFGRRVATRSAPPTVVQVTKGDAIILVTREEVDLAPGHVTGMESLWRVDGAVLHMNGSPHATFLARFVEAGGGDIIRYRNKPMRKLPDAEWAFYDNRAYTMGGIDL